MGSVSDISCDTSGYLTGQSSSSCWPFQRLPEHDTYHYNFVRQLNYTNQLDLTRSEVYHVANGALAIYNNVLLLSNAATVTALIYKASASRT